MSKFNLVVNIDLERVADLQSKGLNLCIAKSFEHSATGTKMTVVWYAKEPLTQNTFEWENDTKLFITLHDHRDIPSEANTRYQPIQYGQCRPFSFSFVNAGTIPS
ncbi:hypothetical protein FRC15_005033 [Serendipita sp. 397]|nr:hypothetical protein FRC15_005033 [Serendipita sp. 397]